jgi:hypothetical protein
MSLTVVDNFNNSITITAGLPSDFSNGTTPYLRYKLQDPVTGLYPSTWTSLNYNWPASPAGYTATIILDIPTVTYNTTGDIYNGRGIEVEFQYIAALQNVETAYIDNIKAYKAPGLPSIPEVITSVQEHSAVILSWEVPYSYNDNSGVKGYAIKLICRTSSPTTQPVYIATETQSGTNSTTFFTDSSSIAPAQQLKEGCRFWTEDNKAYFSFIPSKLDLDVGDGPFQLKVKAFTYCGSSSNLTRLYNNVAMDTNNNIDADGYRYSNQFNIESSGKVYIKANGEWKEGQVYIKVNGKWQEAECIYIKADGKWKESIYSPPVQAETN